MTRMTTVKPFLKIGAMGLGFGGISMADMFRLEANAGITGSPKSVINIHLEGGPPQMDTWDLKPDGPAELRIRSSTTVVVHQ